MEKTGEKNISVLVANAKKLGLWKKQIIFFNVFHFFRLSPKTLKKPFASIQKIQSYYTEDFSQGVMVSCNGFFFNVVCCQVSTNNVHSYQLSCGLDYIALCHVIAYVCFFICSSLFI